MKVKAAVARERGRALSIEGLELDEPRRDEILVRLVACGVSPFDLDAIDGRLPMPCPFVPGCEGAGIVERAGDDVTHVSAGDAVVVSFAFCGQCQKCAAGRPRACNDFAAFNLSGRRIDGSSPFVGDNRDVSGSFFGQSCFATHLVCRASNAVLLPTEAPLEVLACLGGEVMLGAGAILHGFRVQSHDSLIVLGGGAVGLAATMAAKARGASIIIVAEADERRRQRASELGATVAVHPDEGLVDLVRSVAAEGVRFGLDTTGGSAARKACVESLATGGTCALVSPRTGERVDFDDQVAEGSALILSVDGHSPPSVLIPELVRLHEQGNFPLERLIEFFPFERVNDAIDALRSGDAIKPVLRFRLGVFDDLDRAQKIGAGTEASDEEPQDVAVDANNPAALLRP